MLFFRITFDSLRSVRSYGYNLDLYAKLFFEESQICVEFFGEFIFALHLRHVRLPARKLCIYRFHPFSDVVWEVINFLIVNFVSNTSLDCFESIEHIALHHNQFGNPVYHNGILQRNEVNPTATTLTTCNRTELMSQRTHLVSCFIKQFSRERTCSYASTICFEVTVNFSDTFWSYAQSGSGPGTNCIGRSN